MNKKYLKELIEELQTKEANYLRLADEARRQKESLVLISHTLENTEDQEAEIQEELYHPRTICQSQGVLDFVSNEDDTKSESESEADTESETPLSGKEFSVALEKIASIFRDKDIDACDPMYIESITGIPQQQVVQILQRKSGILWEEGASTETWYKLPIKRKGESPRQPLPFKERLPESPLVNSHKTMVDLINEVFVHNPSESLRTEDVIKCIYTEEDRSSWLAEEFAVVHQVFNSVLINVTHSCCNWKRIGKGVYTLR